jgi:hypothetical protein
MWMWIVVVAAVSQRLVLMVSYSLIHHMTLAKQLAINGDGAWLPGISARIFAFKSDIFLHSLHLVVSECNNALVTADQMRKLIQKCWSSVFPEKSESVLISSHPVTSDHDTALVATDQMHQIIQKCWLSVFSEKSEALLISSHPVTSERNTALVVADQCDKSSKNVGHWCLRRNLKVYLFLCI